MSYCLLFLGGPISAAILASNNLFLPIGIITMGSGVIGGGLCVLLYKLTNLLIKDIDILTTKTEELFNGETTKKSEEPKFYSLKKKEEPQLESNEEETLLMDKIKKDFERRDK